MAFHVPFNQRNGGNGRVHIGFERPVQYRQRPKFNWWGFNGLWMSIMAMFTAGSLSIFPLIISVIGLRRGPRKMAAAGTLISFLGVAMFATLIIGGLVAESNRHAVRIRAHQSRVVAKQVKETKTLMSSAIMELEEVRDERSGYLPDDIAANMLVLKHIDPWKNSLRYEAKKEGAVIRSAGPDRDFYTNDDLTESIDGKTPEFEVNIPVD